MGAFMRKHGTALSLGGRKVLHWETAYGQTHHSRRQSKYV